MFIFMEFSSSVQFKFVAGNLSQKLIWFEVQLSFQIPFVAWRFRNEFAYTAEGCSQNTSCSMSWAQEMGEIICLFSPDFIWIGKTMTCWQRTLWLKWFHTFLSQVYDPHKAIYNLCKTQFCTINELELSVNVYWYNMSWVQEMGEEIYFYTNKRQVWNWQPRTFTWPCSLTKCIVCCICTQTQERVERRSAATGVSTGREEDRLVRSILD
jgi:hypothetical protein